MESAKNILLQEVPRYFDEIYNFAIRMTGSLRQAEKLTARVISEAVKFKDYYVPVDTRIWLLRNALNLYAKFYKVRSYRDAVMINKDFENLDQFIDRMQMSDIFKSLSEDDLLKLLLIIPSNVRLALVLKEVNNLTYGTISELMDIPEETVKYRINLARKCIYTELNKKYGQ